MKTVQYFSREYLLHCSKLSTAQILQFLEDFRQLHANRNSSSKLISIKIPADLLNAFRTKAKANGFRYQTQIKRLMLDWIRT